MEQWKNDFIYSMLFGLFVYILLDQMEMIEGMFEGIMIMLTTAILLIVGDIRSRICGRIEQ